MPDIESRGLKMARDTHGERVDPDTQLRIVTAEGAEWARNYVARRFPVTEGRGQSWKTRVCQYENTSNGDFLIDRHPDMPNVWLAGGGSGHGSSTARPWANTWPSKSAAKEKRNLAFPWRAKPRCRERAVF